MLQEVVDIKMWLAADRELEYSSRLQRDREIGGEIEANSDWEKVLAWWQKVVKESEPATGERVATFRGLATLLLFGVGLILGLSIAGVAFAFNGSYPVNLFALFGVLVGLPLLFLVFSLLVLVVPVPGLTKFASMFSALNPGRWISVWLDKSTSLPLFFLTSGSQAETAFSRWQIIRFGQWFSVGYFVGVLVLAWALVVFTDLAFGWSTTLSVEASTVQGWFVGLAWPWREWLTQAVPSLALVEASQFYRLEDNVSIDRAIQLGNWWPFVMMVILVYGLLPRLVFLIYSSWRARVTTKYLLIRDTEVTALLDRLKVPLVAYDPLTSLSEQPYTSVSTGEDSLKFEGRIDALIWNNALGAKDAKHWMEKHWQGEPAIPKNISLDQDAEDQAGHLAKIDSKVDVLLVFVKGWEPPTLDFQDILLDLRTKLDSKVSVVIVPISSDFESINKSDRDIWSVALGDRCPGSYVLGAMS